jgi:hypothetical protein
VAPNAVGLVDVPQDDPAMGFSATPLDPVRRSPLLALELAVFGALCCGTWMVAKPSGRGTRVAPIKHAELARSMRHHGGDDGSLGEDLSHRKYSPPFTEDR